MKWLWDRELCFAQRVCQLYCWVTLIPLFAYFIFYRDFSPSSFALEASAWISGAASILLATAVCRSMRRGEWVFGPTWQDFGWFKKVGALVMALALYFFFVWASLGYPVARVLTAGFGEQGEIVARFEKEKRYSRKRCHHFIRPLDYARWTMKFCIPEAMFESLADDEFVARVAVKESLVGTIFYDVKLD